MPSDLTITQTTTLHITTEATPDEVIINGQRYLPIDGPAVTPAAGDREPGSVANIVDATDYELHELWANTPGSITPSLRAVYNLGREHGAASAKPVAPEPAPAGDVP